ncbi:ABC transporter permease [Geotalea sp. SG265]|uniref:ABC transporter permease n=1 Tax=Geotalea sp. SG265 TaxID=2922867 RepID=UPI001FAFE25F|nr:ABC transporter permease [Geotalea sp. SG265]
MHNKVKKGQNRRVHHGHRDEVAPSVNLKDARTYIASDYNPEYDKRVTGGKEKKFKSAGLTATLNFGSLGNIVMVASLVWFILGVVTIMVRFFLGLPDHTQSSVFVKFVLCGGFYWILIGMLIGGVLRSFSKRPGGFREEERPTDDDDDIYFNPLYAAYDCNVHHQKLEDPMLSHEDTH